MLTSLWGILGNFGVDLNEVAQALASVIAPVFDETGENIIGYTGALAPYVDLPVVGDIIVKLAEMVAENMPAID